MVSDAWVHAIRRDLADEFAPRIDRALSRWPVALEEVVVSGVSCLAVAPSDRETVGSVLYFFGGGYVSGSPETDLPILAPLACLGRLRVIAPRYALAPEHPFPIAFKQAASVYSALDGLLGVAGESAGGGLALRLLSHPAPPKRFALFSPWVDLTAKGLVAAQDDPTLSQADLSKMAETALKGADAKLASPGLTELPDNVPPMFLTTGTQDILRNQVITFVERLKSAGADCTLLDAPDMWHVFEAYDEFAEAEDSLRKAAQFLTS